jgi:hypothetical protein
MEGMGDLILYSHVDAIIVYGAPRHSEWHRVRREHIRRNPHCRKCLVLDDLDVHHIHPFHICPERELDPDNLVTLCRRHHLEDGHLGDWLSWNVSVMEDIDRYRERVKNRPYAVTRGAIDHGHDFGEPVG